MSLKPLDDPAPFAETQNMTGATLTIDLDAIAANWNALDKLSSDAVETAAVVKADAYGLGIDRVATRLANEGVSTFFVAIASEGVSLRRAVGDEPEIFVFSGHMQGATDALAAAKLVPLLNSPEQVTRHFTQSPSLPFGVQLDSGMNRLGMEPEDWVALKDELLSNSPRLVMSHLACADEPEHEMNRRQLRAFAEMTDGIAARRSLSATGGVLLGPEFHFDMTRPGVGLYGGQPFSSATPVVHLSADVIQTRSIKPFETVGYGNTYKADIERQIATISAGYADGLIRNMGQKAQVFAGGLACQMVGRVSMDLITVDVTHLDGAPAKLDILCPNQSIDDLADAAGTIGYEILTSLGLRYTRNYTGHP